MNKKQDMSYLNYTDLNDVENKIEEITNYIKEHYVNMPSFDKKTWVINEFPFIQEISRIEDSIEAIGEWYYKPNMWLPRKIWITPDNLYPIKSFDYNDWNRWVNNLQLIENSFGEALTLWNGTSQIIWDTPSEYEWIDASTYITHDVLYNNEPVLYNDNTVRIIERN